MAKTISTGFLTNTTIGGIPVEYNIPCNAANYTNLGSRSAGYVVMHYTGNAKDTAEANCRYFTTGGRGASAHFFVDDSHIRQSVELRDRAWHCGTSGTYYHNACRNANSIGIEMCTSGNYKISETTKVVAANLCAYICKLIGISASQVDTYVLRHWDITRKSCPAQMTGANNAEWSAFKQMVKNILNGSSTTKSTVNKETTTATVSSGKATSYVVKVTATALNYRQTPGTGKVLGTIKKNERYTIIEEQDINGTKWGKLKSGAGWICLAYTTKV